MSVGGLFWILLIVGVVFGLWPVAPDTPQERYFLWGRSLLILVLIALLGYAEFGAPIKG